LRPKEQVLEFIDSLSTHQWRTYLSYIVMPSSKLPESVRVDITGAFLGEGRCAIIACFEDACQEVESYVRRLCDLKSGHVLVSSGQATLAKLRDAIQREMVLIVKDLDRMVYDLLQEYVSLTRYRTAGSLGVSSKHGLLIYGRIVRRTRYGNPEAATYNKLGRAVFKMVQEQKRSLGFHIVTPESLASQVKPVLEPESPFPDSYLVTSFFSRYREGLILDKGIRSVWK